MKTEIIPVNMKSSKAYIIKSSVSAIVDTGVNGNIKNILNTMECNGIDKSDLKYIIITHAHDDHYGNAGELRKITGARIIAHKKDCETLRKGKNVRFKPHNGFGKFVIKFIKDDGVFSKCSGVNPDIIMDKEYYEINDGGLNFKIIHTPGHTPGSVSVRIDDSIIIGDLLMGGIVNPSKPGYPIWIDDMNAINKSIKKVLDMRCRTWYPAHGKAYDLEKIRKEFVY